VIASPASEEGPLPVLAEVAALLDLNANPRITEPNGRGITAGEVQTHVPAITAFSIGCRSDHKVNPDLRDVSYELG
jgi:hypothetical protein